MWSSLKFSCHASSFSRERSDLSFRFILPGQGLDLKGSVKETRSIFPWGLHWKGLFVLSENQERKRKNKEKKMMKLCPCFSNPQQLPNSPRDSFDEGLTGYRGHSNKLFALFTFRSRGKGISKRCLFLHTNKSSQVFDYHFGLWTWSHAGSSRQKYITEEIKKYGNVKSSGKIFKFKELIAATDNFSMECMIGEGGFGRVYKGFLTSLNQVPFSISLHLICVLHTELVNKVSLIRWWL